MRGIYRSILVGLVVLAGCRHVTTPPRVAPPAPVTRPLVVPPASTPVAVPRVTPVILVKPTSSTQVVTNRRYGEKITTRMADWLSECGIPTTVVTDDQLTQGAWRKARVVVLPCTLHPNPAEIAALRQFTGAGGKVIVFFGAEPRLASLLGFKLGAQVSAAGGPPWRAFQMVSGAAPIGAPSRVTQESNLLRPVYPAADDARVMAWWDPKAGSARLPAWVASPHGFWMSHVLLEGDVATKKQLLVSLLGACDPSLWKAAAARTCNRAGTLEHYANASQAIAAIGREARADRRVGALLTEAGELRTRITQSYRAAEYARVTELGCQLDAVLTEAYARTHAGHKGEFRGIWNHSGTGFAAGQWEATCAALAKAGITDLFPNFQRPWCAHYPSRLIPASDVLSQQGDQVSACLEAAHRHGLKVHAWVILWNLEGAPESVIAPYRHAGRTQVSAKGGGVDWLCPSNPKNRAFELEAVRDLLKRYPKLEGIHLDYIRLKSKDTCYCAGCRARFTQATGLKPAAWPADARSGHLAEAYRTWRRGQITQFVAEVRRAIRKIDPKVKLSASVYPLYPGTRDSIAQDWGEWLRTETMDFVCPMNYTDSTAQCAEWYRKQTAYPGVKGKLYAGIGVTSMEARLSAAQTLSQIDALRKEGAPGFMLFEANTTVRDDILPVMEMMGGAGETLDR